jgi:hypothetical protein
MKTSILNKSSLIILVIMAMISIMSLSEGCKPSQQVAMKTGAQLWAENCQRCHNTPSPSSFSGEQWETIGMHMQTRALITEDEKNKIVGFLKQ